MKALACVNSKAEKVAGIVVNGEPNRLGIWLEKDCECWCFFGAEVFDVAGWCLWCRCCSLGSPTHASHATLDGSFPLRPERRWHKPTGNPSGRTAPSLLGSSLSLCRSKPWVRRWPGFLSAPCWALEAGLGRVMLQQPGRNTASHPWSSLSCSLLLPALTNSHCWSASIHLLFWWVSIVHSN